MEQEGHLADGGSASNEGFNQEKALVGAFSVIVQPVVEPMGRFTALIITNPTPHPHLAATLLLLCAPSRDKISVVVKILPAANIRRRDETQGDSVFSTGARRVSGRELVGVTSNKWKLSRTGFSGLSAVFPTTIHNRAVEVPSGRAGGQVCLSSARFVWVCGNLQGETSSGLSGIKQHALEENCPL